MIQSNFQFLDLALNRKSLSITGMNAYFSQEEILWSETLSFQILKSETSIWLLNKILIYFLYINLWLVTIN